MKTTEGNKLIAKINANEYFQKWKIGTIYEPFANCNSRHRIIIRVKNDNDCLTYNLKLVHLRAEINNILHVLFYKHEDSIKTVKDFNEFLDVFRKIIEDKYGKNLKTYNEISCGDIYHLFADINTDYLNDVI